MPAGLPSDLDFQIKKSLPRGVRSYKQNVSVIGGLSIGGEQSNLKFDIPCGRPGTYIDPAASFLQIRVQAGATGDVYLDGSAYSLIERFQILSGGQTVEDILAYGNLNNLLIDNQLSTLGRQTAGSILLGCGNNSTINVMRGGAVIPAGTSTVFCLPLVSGFFSNLDKYLPVGAISDLRMELQLQTQANAVVNTAAGVTSCWSITEANLMLSYVELEAEVQRMIDASTGGKYFISTETFRSYQNNVSGTTSSDSLLIPARFSSVKGIMQTFRPSIQQNNFLTQSQTHRINPFSGTGGAPSIQFSIGSSLYPQTAIRSSAELYAETQKHFHMMGTTDYRGVISSANWNINTDPTALAAAAVAGTVTLNANASGTGFLAINLEAVNGRSSLMNSGISTLGTNIIENLTYSTPLYGSQLRVDSYVHVDAVLVIEGGVLTIRM
jgi:hypothetical protein